MTKRPLAPLDGILHTFGGIRPFEGDGLVMEVAGRPSVVYPRAEFDRLHPHLYDLLKRDADVLFADVVENTFPEIDLARRSLCYLHWLRDMDAPSIEPYTVYLAHAVLGPNRRIEHKPTLFTVHYSRSVDDAGAPHLSYVAWGYELQITAEHLEVFSPGSSRRMATGVAMGLPADELNAFVFPKGANPHMEVSLELPCSM